MDSLLVLNSTTSYLRSIMKIKWDDYVSYNEQVLTRANIKDIEVLPAKSRLRWLGQVGQWKMLEQPK